MHYGDCCLQSTSTKSHFLPFIGQEGPKLEMYDYSTTYMTPFQYIFMSPPVELPFSFTGKLLKSLQSMNSVISFHLMQH